MNGQVKRWTLEECITYAVENNLTIEQSALNVESVKIDKKDALGNLLPSLNASGSFSKSVGFAIIATSNNPTTGNQSSQDGSGSITSNLTLYDGLQNIRQVQRAKLNAIASQYQLEDLKDDIRLSVAQAYLQVLSNKEQLKSFRGQYAITEQDLKRTKELVDAGVVARGDLLNIEATAATQEQQIVNGEGLVLISRLNLAQLLQLSDYENFDVVEEEYEIPPSDILNNSARAIYEKALSFRNDIKLSEFNVELAQKDVEISRGAYQPTLSGFFNYRTRYNNLTGPLPDNVTGEFFTPGFIDQLWLFDGISYGVQLNVPIFNGWSVRNNVQRSKISLENTRLQLEADKLDLEITVQQAYVDVTTFEKAYEAALKTLEATSLAYDYSKDRFEVGLIDSFDFSQAQTRVDNAAADAIRTKFDYIFRLKILEFYFDIPLTLE